MKTLTIITTLALYSLACPTAQAVGDAAKGKALSSACSSCHGSYGVSNSDAYPTIAGQHQGYLIKALQQYQSGQRSDLTMQAQVGPLSAQDIENLAAFFSANSIIPSYTDESRLLQIPYVGVGAGFYQGDLHYLPNNTFELTTIKPLQ